MARAAATLFSRLEMTPGASKAAKDYAKACHWAPPLAWDEAQLDEEAARPDRGARRRPGFLEAYEELRMLGFTDLRIADRMGVQPGSLVRQMRALRAVPAPSWPAAACQHKHRSQKAS